MAPISCRCTSIANPHPVPQGSPSSRCNSVSIQMLRSLRRFGDFTGVTIVTLNTRVSQGQGQSQAENSRPCNSLPSVLGQAISMGMTHPHFLPGDIMGLEDLGLSERLGASPLEVLLLPRLRLGERRCFQIVLWSSPLFLDLGAAFDFLRLG